LDQNRRELVIKVVNPTPGSVNAGISLQGLSGLGRQAKVITLSHAEATAENTLENPRLIVPVESALTVPGTEFSAVFTPNSLTVLRVPVQTR
jgi:alpha-L-arabinofuranosidase